MNKYRSAAAAIGVTGFAFVVNYLIVLFLTPVITDSIGTESYGFVTLAKNMAQYATYATLALNSFATRYISIEYHRGNYQKANEYFNSTFFGDIGLGSIVFAILLVIALNIEKLFHVPEEIVWDVKTLFLLVFTKFWVITSMSANDCGAMVANKLYITGTFRLIAYVVQAAVLIFLFLKETPHVYYVGVALMVSDLIEMAANLMIRKKYTPELKTDISMFQWRAVKLLVVSGIWSSINSMGSFLNSGLDLAVCNLMLTPLLMGQLAIAESISLIFKTICTLTARPFQPYILKSYAQEDRDGMFRHMFFSMKVSSMLTNVCFAGFASLGLTYYKLWIPNQDIRLIWELTMVSIIASVSSGIVYSTFYFYTLTLRKKIPCIMTLMSGFLNVIGMYFLIKYTGLGVYAVVWTTAVLMTILNLILHPLYQSYILNIPKLTFYPVIGRCLLSCAALTAVFMALSRIYMPAGWIAFFITAGVYAVIGSILHIIIVATKEERVHMIRRFRRVAS